MKRRQICRSPVNESLRSKLLRNFAGQKDESPMGSLSTQDKILYRLQVGLQTPDLEAAAEDAYCEYLQTPAGEKVQHWKEVWQHQRVVAFLKKMPVAGKTAQWLYRRLTRVRKNVFATEILKLDNEKFVSAMYRAVLEREPDACGRENVLAQLALGMAKEDLLHNLIRSGEARQFRIRLVGVRRFGYHRVKMRLKSMSPIFTALSYMHKLLLLPQRFYRLVLTVQELLKRMQETESRVALQEKFSEEQKKQAQLDRAQAQKMHNGILEKLAQLQSRLENSPQVSGGAASPRSRFRALDYYRFEEKFRGPRALIKERQRDYLGFVQNAFNLTSAEFLDIGCGRGEFLELLNEQHIPVRGVDLDAKNVDYCQSLGLSADCADGLSALRASANASLAGVTAFQVVEHLEPDYLNELIFTAYEKIQAKGCIIFETVNPSSFYSLRNFYLDLSHKKPIPPEVLKFLIGQAGFQQVHFHFSSPVDKEQKLQGDGEDARKLNQLLYGDQEYAVIGIK